MPYQVVRREVNLQQYPEVDSEHLFSEGAQITVGDLHGHCVKLLFMLVHHGIVTNVDEQRYKKFNALFLLIADMSDNPDVAVFIEQFDDLVASFEFNTAGHLLLLGDLLADRMGNDKCMLLMISALAQAGVSLTILLSNHDYLFIRNYEDGGTDYTRTGIICEQAISMVRCAALLANDLVSLEFINQSMEECYLPALKLLAYTLNEAETEITIYSHAPIGLETIVNLARFFRVAYDQSSAQSLAQTIDALNQCFMKDAVLKKEINFLVGKRDPISRLFDPSAEPVAHLMWNRDCDNLLRPMTITPPEVALAYQLNFVHGHHSPSVVEPGNVVDLNNRLGVSALHNSGLYTVLYTQDKPAPKPIKMLLELEEALPQLTLGAENAPLQVRHRSVSMFAKKVDTSSARLSSESSIPDAALVPCVLI